MPAQSLELLGCEDHIGRKGVEPLEVVVDRHDGGHSPVDWDLCVVAVPPADVRLGSAGEPPSDDV